MQTAGKMPVANNGDDGDGRAAGKAKKKASRRVKAGPSITSHLDHNTQLMEAIAQAKPRLVRRLLDTRADPNHQAGAKMLSPLMLACEIKEEAARESIFELLLNKGADINLQDASRQTVLMKVIINGLTNVGKLLKLGADVRVEDVDGNVALSYAAEAGDAEWVHVLVREGKRRGVHIDHQNLHGLTPLLLAAREGHLAAARVLVEGGASSSKRDLDHFMTALEWMKLTGCYPAQELEFLNPSSRKRDFYRRERMKKGIKTLADFLPTVEEGGAADSPNVFALQQPEASHFQFPTMPSNLTAEEPTMKSMFDIPISKKQPGPSLTQGSQRRINSISFPTVSSVKTDLYKSSYLSRRKSLLLKNSLSDGYHSGALASLGSTATSGKDISPAAKGNRLPPINKT